MKRRDYKQFAEGTILHIYNRGNNREKIFRDEQDYKAFLFRVGLALGIDANILQNEKLCSIPYSRIRVTGNNGLFKLHAFCLMPNHFHLLIEQCGDVPVSKLVSQICTSYSMYINKKHQRVGHVFQERFKSVLIENNAQLMWISSYIHMNAIKSGIVKHPREYQWSSYNDFTTKRKLPITSTDFLISIFGAENFEKETLIQYEKD